jgi:glycyl-tRNA synthetase
MPSNSQLQLKTIVDYARRKGFVFPSSEIYGGYAATYDFGPLGKLLKDNLVQSWRDFMVNYRTDTVEIEGAIFLHPKVWEASGHIGGFSDLLVEDTVTHKRFRADHLVEDAGIIWPASSNETLTDAGSLSAEEIDQIIEHYKLKSPDGNPLSKAKKFNLLVKTHLGPVEDESTVAYLKGEACQNIYVDWKSVQETTRRKLPFGIAQLGKAFRNEITVKQFLFRTREFEQIDMQYFVKPPTQLSENDKDHNQWFNYWRDERYNFYTQFLGYQPENLKWHQHSKEELVFYAAEAWDIYYNFGEIGFKEMEGVHNRTDYDTRQHQKFSGTDLTYFDPENNQRYLPYIVEMSLGVNRLFLSSLFEFYKEELVGEGEKAEARVVLQFPYKLAPYKVAVLPLMKKDGLAEKAMEIYKTLRKQGIMADYDEAGSIGKRYRRQDENGTPWCLCVDYDTLKEGETFNTVTLRHRDTMEQVRVSIADLETFIKGF